LTEAPAVNALRASAIRFITFGCLNNFAKVNDRVLALRARVLLAVDGARLLLLAPEGRFRQDTLDRLDQAGIGSARVAFAP
jgi:predicted O-linked N-acetylglucosamine transferase (SPINDLY family)